MARERFYVTYDVVTPESAEYGDTAEYGFASPGGWRTADRPEPVTLREAIKTCGLYPWRYDPTIGPFEDSGTWFTTIDADQDFRTGEHTTYSIHPPRDITLSSYNRICRYLTGRSARAYRFAQPARRMVT